jgi:uroporphyrinogen-III synthase
MVTRAATQAGELCELLESRGAVPVPVPMIRTETVAGSEPLLRGAVKDMGGFAWVVFTSANAVDSFMKLAALPVGVASGAAGTVRGSSSAGPLVAAVGPATVSALARHGIAPSFVPSEFSANALANGLAAHTPQGIAGARVLFPRAEKARDAVTSVLSARGAEVVEMSLYRTSAAVVEPAVLARLEGGMDAILFMSGSAVDAFSYNARHAPGLSEAARTAAIGCIGPSTAEVARARGLPVHFVADEHTAAGLVNALERYFDARRAESASVGTTGPRS